GGEARELLRVAQASGPDGAWPSALRRVAQTGVEVVVARVAAGFEELVGVEVVGHLVGRVERARLRREQLMPVAEGRVLEAQRQQVQGRPALVQLLDQRETAAHELETRERAAFAIS